MSRRATVLVVVVALLVVLVVVVLTTTSEHGGGPVTPGGQVPATVSSSVTTPGQSSVIVAMGHLDDPSNTFWELFLRRAGSPTWVLATPPGVATNGGLVASVPVGGPLTAGFLTSADLTFSPVAATTDDGATWNPGQLPGALVPRPDALAWGPPGTTAAVVATSGQTLETSSGDLDDWRPTGTSSALAPVSSDCHLQALTAVAFDVSDVPVVGATCTDTDRVGLFAPAQASSSSVAGPWRSVGPPVAGGLDKVGSSVLRLDATSAGLAGLVQVTSPTGTTMNAIWEQGVLGRWFQSGAPSVPSGWTLLATGIGGGGGSGATVLLGRGYRRVVAVIPGPGHPWSVSPPAPDGASAVATVGDETDAFVSDNSVLTVWAWSPGSTSWRHAAAITVAIPYGSSN